MQIFLNGQTIDTQQTTLDALLDEQGYGDSAVATAFNKRFVPIAERGETHLHDDCVIDVVAPMQGG